MKLSDHFRDRTQGSDCPGDISFREFLEEKAADMDPLAPDDLEKRISDGHFALFGEVPGPWWTEVGIPQLKVRARGVLVTAFEPFGGETMNPTVAILGELPETVGSFALRKLLLPVEFVRARETACAEYDRLRPAAVVMLGQAGGRSTVTVETTGKNVMNGRIPDNSGYEPHGEPVDENGPEKLFSSADVDGIVRAVSAVGIPCERSDDAGEYVCNALLYGMLYHNGGKVPTVFIHVPYATEQGHIDKPSMEIRDMTRASLAAIRSVTEQIESGIVGM